MSLKKEWFLELLSIPSPSGFEEVFASRLLERYAPYGDQVLQDAHGNVAVVLNPDAPYTVMLEGHMDEIGYMITHVDDNGFLYFQPIGGPDRATTEGQRVRVFSESENRWVKGVVGGKPIHLKDRDERDRARKYEEMWIDVGARNREEAEALFRVGAPVVLDWDAEELLNGRIVGRGIDDRVGVFLAFETLRVLRESGLRDIRVVAVAAVQEEIGLRGARTIAYEVYPDVAVALDVDFATDAPSHEKDQKRVGKVVLGKGPVLLRGPNITPAVFERLEEVAKKENIPYQIVGAPGATGTDAWVMQVARGAIPTGLVGIPNRYMHTPAEMVDLEDLENIVKLLAGFVRSFEAPERRFPRGLVEVKD